MASVDEMVSDYYVRINSTGKPNFDKSEVHQPSEFGYWDFYSGMFIGDFFMAHNEVKSTIRGTFDQAVRWMVEQPAYKPRLMCEITPNHFGYLTTSKQNIVDLTR